MNLPNKISILRITMIPVVAIFFLMEAIPYGKAYALGIFLIASLTDMLDGYIARKYNMITNLGKMLDSIADKILNFAGLALVILDGVIPHPYGIIALLILVSRDFIMDFLRQMSAYTGKMLAADMFGKVRAFVLMATIPYLMFMSLYAVEAWFTGAWLLTLNIIGYSLLGICVVLSVASLINYLVKNKEVLKG